MKRKDFLTLVDSGILSLVDYYPYRSENRNQNTRRIMDLKSVTNFNFNSSCLYFSDLLQRILRGYNYPFGKLQIVIVPSSTAGLLSDGLVCIVNHLSLPPDVLFKPNVLVRHTTVDKARLGGSRAKSKHFDSIDVGDDLYTNIPIMLLDDVTSTGNTLNACKDILMQKGYQNIVMVSIGRTVND